jgi:hypothetical protein
LHWPAAAVVEDWDTYEDGIWTVSPLGFNPTGVNTETKASVAYQSTSSAGFPGWFISGNYPASRYWDIAAGDVIPPAVAVWDATDGNWLGWSTPTTPPSTTNVTTQYNVDGAGGSYFAGKSGNVVVIVYLTQVPTNFAGWSNYA